MVEVFKTNIQGKRMAREILKILTETFPGYKINFDLEDKDRVMRVETAENSVEVIKIIAFFERKSLNCEVLNG